jgi:hypothetical protein
VILWLFARPNGLPIEYFVYKGKVFSLYKRKSEKNTEVTMWMLLDKQTSMQGKCLTDSNGKFNFALGNLYGKGKLSLQTKQKGKRKDLNIILDRNFSPLPKSFLFDEAVLPKTPVEECIEETAPSDANDFMPADSVKSHLLPEILEKGKRGFHQMPVETIGIFVNVCLQICYSVINPAQLRFKHHYRPVYFRKIAALFPLI